MALLIFTLGTINWSLVTFKLVYAGFCRKYYNYTKGNYPQWPMLQIPENNQLLWRNVYLMGTWFVPYLFLVLIAWFVMVHLWSILIYMYLVPIKAYLARLKLFWWWCPNVVLYHLSFEFWRSARFPAGNIVHCSWNPNWRLIQDW